MHLKHAYWKKKTVYFTTIPTSLFWIWEQLSKWKKHKSEAQNTFFLAVIIAGYRLLSNVHSWFKIGLKINLFKCDFYMHISLLDAFYRTKTKH